jgi:hypothetical protein
MFRYLQVLTKEYSCLKSKKKIIITRILLENQFILRFNRILREFIECMETLTVCEVYPQIDPMSLYSWNNENLWKDRFIEKTASFDFTIAFPIVYLTIREKLYTYELNKILVWIGLFTIML